MSSFQDPILRDSTKYTANSIDHKSADQTQLREQSTEAPQEHIAAEFETHFKTLHINGIRVSSEKSNKDTHFKTPTDGTCGSREQHR